jgi:hypothetical protein
MAILPRRESVINGQFVLILAGNMNNVAISQDESKKPSKLAGNEKRWTEVLTA